MIVIEELRFFSSSCSDAQSDLKKFWSRSFVKLWWAEVRISVHHPHLWTVGQRIFPFINHTFTRCHLCIRIRILWLVLMNDKRYSHPSACGAMQENRKKNSPRVRRCPAGKKPANGIVHNYPCCIQMERRDWRGFRILNQGVAGGYAWRPEDSGTNLFRFSGRRFRCTTK